MSDLTKLADRLEKYAKSLPNSANDAAKRAASAVAFDLDNVTPADVGEAISNWQASLDNPATNIIEAYVPSPRGKMKDGVWTHSVDPEITRANNAPVAFAEAKIVITEKRPGQSLFLTNNTPQIVPLDQGSSTQEPQGFVRRALIVGRNILDKVKLVL